MLSHVQVPRSRLRGDTEGGGGGWEGVEGADGASAPLKIFLTMRPFFGRAL